MSGFKKLQINHRSCQFYKGNIFGYNYKTTKNKMPQSLTPIIVIVIIIVLVLVGILIYKIRSSKSTPSPTNHPPPNPPRPSPIPGPGPPGPSPSGPSPSSPPSPAPGQPCTNTSCKPGYNCVNGTCVEIDPIVTIFPLNVTWTGQTGGQGSTFNFVFTSNNYFQVNGFLYPGTKVPLNDVTGMIVSPTSIYIENIPVTLSCVNGVPTMTIPQKKGPWIWKANSTC